MTSFAIAWLLISFVEAVKSFNSSETATYSHAQCTVPFLDEHPATHYRGTWGLQQFLEARALQRVCVYSNVCIELVQRSQALAFINMQSFVPPLSISESHSSPPPQHLGFERFIHSGTEFEFEIMHGAVPGHYAWALDAGAKPHSFSFQTVMRVTWSADVHFLTESYANNNFGHLLIDDLYSVFHAMQHWGIGGFNTSRILSFWNCAPDVPWACDRYNYLMKGILMKPSIHIGAYHNTHPTCFRKLVVGHQVAWGQAFQFSRGGPSLRSFRDSLLANLNLSFGVAPSIHRVNFYAKTHGLNGPSWPDICDLIPKLQSLWAIDARCIQPANMNLEEQFLEVKNATVHVTPHGAVSYLLLFARAGASSVILVDNNCGELQLHPDNCKPKDLQIMPFCPWLNLFYHKRGSATDVMTLITHAIREASFNMGLALPPPV